jgi:hypothetical protein
MRPLGTTIRLSEDGVLIPWFLSDGIRPQGTTTSTGEPEPELAVCRLRLGLRFP